MCGHGWGVGKSHLLARESSVSRSACVQQKWDQLPSAARWTKFQCRVPHSIAYNWLSQLECCGVRKTSRTGSIKGSAVTAVTCISEFRSSLVRSGSWHNNCVALVTNKQIRGPTYLESFKLSIQMHPLHPCCISPCKYFTFFLPLTCIYGICAKLFKYSFD